MDPPKSILPNSSKLSSSSNSISNIVNSRGNEYSPTKTLQEYSSTDTKKMEQTISKDINDVTAKPDIEAM